MKHVAALGGARVCRRGLDVRIEGVLVGRALARDRMRRALPVWQGCLQLTPQQIFLLNRKRADSLDGRYFGSLSITAVVGRALPVWTLKDE